LTYRTTTDMLKRVFEKYGDVGDVYIPRDPHTQARMLFKQCFAQIFWSNNVQSDKVESMLQF